MTVLAFDTETTGFLLKNKPLSDPDQPHLVQLGVALYDDDGTEKSYASMIVKPDGWIIPEGAAAVHKITTEKATEIGLPLVYVLATFSQFAKAATQHVAHNIEFDLKILLSEFIRANRGFPPVTSRCTKELAEPVMKLPPTERMISVGLGNKFKSPNLTECMKFFFDENLADAHDALVDTRACARVFFELEKRRIADGKV